MKSLVINNQAIPLVPNSVKYKEGSKSTPEYDTKLILELYDTPKSRKLIQSWISESKIYPISFKETSGKTVRSWMVRLVCIESINEGIIKISGMVVD